MESVKIPQNVRIEDKIIGPLSIKQLIIIGLGVGFSYAMFSMIKNAVGSVPLSAHMFIWWPAILAGAFSIVRINDISLFRYCLLVIEMLSRPRKRLWEPREGLVIHIQTRSSSSSRGKLLSFGKKQKPKEISEELSGESGIGHIDELSSLLDQEGGKAGKPKSISVDPLVNAVDPVSHP